MNRIIHGDAIEEMKKLEESSIDLVVTSPPYDNLRNYKGYTFNFEEIAKQLFRVTKDGGVVVWVVGDATINGSETGTSFKQALYFKEIGFNLHDTMIYKKNNYMPLNHNRYDPCFEYVFILSKGKPKTFNPLMIACKTAGSKYNYATRSSASSKEKNGALRSRDEEKITNSHKYRGNIWGYDVGKHKGSKDDIWKHPATFPEKLAEDHILSWSNEGDLVLDPMCGSGTTCKMAKINNRKYLGFDISEEYCEISQDRLDGVNAKDGMEKKQ
jgi:site-specific DNA-methyltransferase (adenine-specific)